MSRPVWGAWIEMQQRHGRPDAVGRRAPYGARGLKYCKYNMSAQNATVAPRMGRVD